MKKCDTCIYRNENEYHKPCIVYRDDCEFYEKARGDMTREEAKKIIHRHVMLFASMPDDVLEAIQALEQEPKTGHWIEKEGFDGDVYYDCSECGESFCLIEGTPTDNLYNYCPNCGCRMVEPQKSEE